MKKQLILSSSQSAAFSMGRVLIELESWYASNDSVLEVERAILIDFGVQHPRAFVRILPELRLVLEANLASRNDFGDLFVHKHFGGMREKFIVTLNDLIARELIQQLIKDETFTLELTEKGREVSNHLSSAYSLMLRAISDVFTASWKRRPVADLYTEIRLAIPRDNEALVTLGEPFGEWMVFDGK